MCRGILKSTTILHRAQMNLKDMYSVAFHIMQVNMQIYSCSAVVIEPFQRCLRYGLSTFQIELQIQCYSLISAESFK